MLNGLKSLIIAYWANKPAIDIHFQLWLAWNLTRTYLLSTKLIKTAILNCCEENLTIKCQAGYVVIMNKDSQVRQGCILNWCAKNRTITLAPKVVATAADMVFSV